METTAIAMNQPFFFASAAAASTAFVACSRLTPGVPYCAGGGAGGAGCCAQAAVLSVSAAHNASDVSKLLRIETSSHCVCFSAPCGARAQAYEKWNGGG